MSDHIPDVTKMISDTPRTDRNYIGMQIVPASFAQQLERELNAVSKERDEAVFVTEKVLKEFSEHSRSRCKAIDELNAAKERLSKLNDYVAALETAGDLMANELSYGYDVDMWHKAKEAKP